MADLTLAPATPGANAVVLGGTSAFDANDDTDQEVAAKFVQFPVSFFGNNIVAWWEENGSVTTTTNTGRQWSLGNGATAQPLYVGEDCVVTSLAFTIGNGAYSATSAGLGNITIINALTVAIETVDPSTGLSADIADLAVDLPAGTKKFHAGVFEPTTDISIPAGTYIRPYTKAGAVGGGAAVVTLTLRKLGGSSGGQAGEDFLQGNDIAIWRAGPVYPINYIVEYHRDLYRKAHDSAGEVIQPAPPDATFWERITNRRTAHQIETHLGPPPGTEQVDVETWIHALDGGRHIVPGVIERPEGVALPHDVSIDWNDGELSGAVDIFSGLTWGEQPDHVSVEIQAHVSGGGGLGPVLRMTLVDEHRQQASAYQDLDADDKVRYYEFEVTRDSDRYDLVVETSRRGTDSGTISLHSIDVLGFAGTSAAARLIAQVADRLINLEEENAMGITQQEAIALINQLVPPAQRIPPLAGHGGKALAVADSEGGIVFRDQEAGDGGFKHFLLHVEQTAVHDLGPNNATNWGSTGIPDSYAGPVHWDIHAYAFEGYRQWWGSGDVVFADLQWNNQDEAILLSDMILDNVAARLALRRHGGVFEWRIEPTGGVGGGNTYTSPKGWFRWEGADSGIIVDHPQINADDQLWQITVGGRQVTLHASAATKKAVYDQLKHIVKGAGAVLEDNAETVTIA